jgi:hypothetical protein
MAMVGASDQIVAALDRHTAALERIANVMETPQPP